ncbi:MAG: hypothetical protein LBG79_07785 [Spirochaetaceae bacterium]|nr:hypothetical protein [Spirochaetaceae bacterium]
MPEFAFSLPEFAGVCRSLPEFTGVYRSLPEFAAGHAFVGFPTQNCRLLADNLASSRYLLCAL